MCNEPEDPYFSRRGKQKSSLQRQRASPKVEESLSRARTQVRVPRRRAATPRQPPVQLECSLYRFPFCSPSHFSTLILSTSSSRSSSLFLPFLLLSRTWRRLRYFFIMHTFAGAIAISFGLVSALSARKSIFTVAEHQTRKRWLLSQSLFLSKIFLEAKITRGHKFTVKTESFSLVLVSPLSLSNIYRGGFCGRGVNEIRRSAEWNGIDFMKSHISANSVGLADTARRNEFCLSTVRSFVIRVFWRDDSNGRWKYDLGWHRLQCKRGRERARERGGGGKRKKNKEKKNIVVINNEILIN